MTDRSRFALFAISLCWSVGLDWLFYPRILVPEAPAAAVFFMSLLSWALWFILLVPIWLPAVVPNSKPRLLSRLSLLCGTVLFLPTVLFVVLIFLGERSISLACAAALTALVGAWHITRRSIGSPSALNELQR